MDVYNYNSYNYKRTSKRQNLEPHAPITRSRGMINFNNYNNFIIIYYYLTIHDDDLPLNIKRLVEEVRLPINYLTKTHYF